MSEPTLTLTYTSLKQEVGFYLGYGRDSNAWDSDQTSTVNFVVTSGLRQFYSPPPLAPGQPSYDWSFLRPCATFTLPTGESAVPMHDDFGGVEGDVTVTTVDGNNIQPWRLRLCNESYVRELYASNPQRTGRPLHAALEWLKGTTIDRSQRARITVWPVADADYLLRLNYYVNADALSDSFPYHMGGMAHSETILASCKWAAERDLDDQADGPQKRNFMERLAASIGKDRLNKPQALGYNADRSDRHWNGRWGEPGNRHLLNYGGVSVNGVVY